MAKLAAEFKVGLTTLKRNFSDRVTTIRGAATSLAMAEMIVSRMDVSDQTAVRNLADQLKGLSSSLLKTAETNGKTAERLSDLAQKQVESLTLGPDMTSEEVLKAGDRLNLAGGLLVMSNRATTLGTKLLAANDGTGADAGGTVIVETGVPHD
jgi:hypothetical protein